ncbi:MAG TPA: GNAT family N-acetyltransferase [Desulfotomaculum sp.]|nr:GNAT family N-acetyltransferase [Desulfotomaculum sp.]
MIKIVNKVEENKWKKLLDTYDKATIYHTPEWKKTLEGTFGYKAHYFFAIDECGELVGLLPLFYVRSQITGSRICSVPFAHNCGPIGDEATVSFLAGKAIDLYKDLNADYFEVKDKVGFDNFEYQNAFSTYILELSPDLGIMWKKLDSGSARWGVKKSHKEGVSVSKTQSIEDLKEFYELNCITKKKIGVPCHPWKFFKNLFKFLDSYVSLYVARYNDKIIAGGIMEYFKKTVLYGYGAADPKYLKMQPYNAFIWKSIEDACLNGYKYYDFGRTSYDNVGLINFKKRWGTAEKKLYYSYYPKNPVSLTENRENLKYKWGTKVIQRMPMPIYKKFSDVVFGSFG